jgi:hypothetical protein
MPFAKGQTIPPENRHHRGEDESPPNPTMINLNPHTSFTLSYLGEMSVGQRGSHSSAISFPTLP